MQKVPKGVKMAFRRGGYDWITIGFHTLFKYWISWLYRDKLENYCYDLHSKVNGYIDVGDGCWRQNLLMTTKMLVTVLAFWSPTSTIFYISGHQHSKNATNIEVTNITMSPTSLSPKWIKTPTAVPSTDYRSPNNLHLLVKINWSEFLDCYRYWVFVFLVYSDGTTFSDFLKREPKQDFSLILHAAKFTVRSDLLISPKLVMKSYK